VRQKRLKYILDELYAARSPRHLANDPLAFCHRYPDPQDQEVVGFIASAFAYGNVRAIRSSLERIFTPMGVSPRRFVEALDPDQALKLYAGFKHRFNDHRDLCALLLACRTMIEEAESINEFVLAGHDPAAADSTDTLATFSSSILALDYSPVFGGNGILTGSSFPFLVPSPAKGSACKRLCMYLRWMVRPADGIDLGLWRGITPAQLIIPVDAHICRIGRYLGLTKRRQADWRMAREITAALRQLDPADPVKYDFSLCHLGISEGCGRNRQQCLTCTISSVCRPD
jgi:uncharacterized protein (TIGR02757 family)